MANTKRLQEGDVLTYKDYKAQREKGSELRGHHVPQQQGLKEMRTFAGRGAKTASTERGLPLSQSEAADLADPPIKSLAPTTRERVQQMNRQNLPEFFSNE